VSGCVDTGQGQGGMGPPNEWDRHHHQHNQGRKATVSASVRPTVRSLAKRERNGTMLLFD
jgi:hypothetical protein